MKLLPFIRMINESQFLIERDVINAKELKAWAKESAARLTDPQAATWYASQLSKYLINRYEQGLRTAQFDAQAPDWVMAKLNAGEQIFTVEPMPELRREAEGVIDYLNAMTAENSSPNLRMTWEEAVEAQADWHRDMARASRVTELTADQMEGIVSIMEFDDGFRWVDVQTEVCLQHEGTVMGHCVGQGGYTQGVSDSTTKILSLRDANNNPHATVEGVSKTPIIVPRNMNPLQYNLFDTAVEKSFIDITIIQIKGKENKAVVRKYRDYVQSFLMKFQISKFGHGGLDDLENCGLFNLRTGGFVAVEDIGEKVARMDDGSIWQRVDDEYVELTDHSSVHAKWYLYDKTGRSVGNMIERQRGVIQQLMNFGSDTMKYKDHVNTAFNSKYDKNREAIKPASNLYGGGTNDILGKFGLGVNGSLQVGEPQTIGKLKVQTEAGDVYATAQRDADGDQYWLMHGDIVQCRFTAETSGSQYGIHFVGGIPNGSMPNFLTKLEENLLAQPMGIDHIRIGDNTLARRSIEWKPQSIDELIMEQDGVKFYSHHTDKGGTWYNAVDAHNHHIFNMSIESTNFKTRMVSDKKVAGFYAVYLIDGQDLDIGEFTDYSSFARELLDETSWFEGEQSNTWYVEDENFPVHLTQTETFEDGTEEEFYDEDTIMLEYWKETGLYDSGMENDSFAKEYEQVYRGGNTGDYNEHSPYDDEGHGDNPLVRTDYYVEGIGNADTVTHPVSGGTVSVKK